MTEHTSIEMANHYYGGGGIDNYTCSTAGKVSSTTGEYLAIPSSTDAGYYKGVKDGSYMCDQADDPQGCSSYYIQTSDGHRLSATLLDARTMKHRKRSRKCCIKIYAWLVSLTLTTFIAVILIGFSIVRPYLKVHDFHRGFCTAREANYSETPNACWCGKGCKSSHPCLELLVDTGQRHPGNYTKISENEISRGKVRVIRCV